MSDYYTPSGVPADNAERAASVLRAEFSKINDGFARFPNFSGNQGKVWIMGASVVEATTPPWLNAANPQSTGVNQHTATATPGRILIRTGAAVNSVDEYRHDGGAIFAGHGGNGVWACGPSSDLSGGTNNFFRASAAGIKVKNGATIAELDFGQYTPTQTGSMANVDSYVASGWRWIRIGNYVIVSGTLSIDATAASTTTTIKFTPPINSAFTAQTDVTGTLTDSTSNLSGEVICDVATLSIRFSLVPTVTTNRQYSFQCMYEVK